MTNSRNSNLVSILLFGTAVLVFLPALRNGFVNFDDNVYFYENPHVNAGLTWQSLLWAFRNLDAGFWQPLTWLSILIDRQLFGPGPQGPHFTNILLHAFSVVTLFRFLTLATGAIWRSAVVAALFAVHPLNVEPVAWAASRKDVLSAFFSMLTLLTYVRYVKATRSSRAADIVSSHYWKTWFYILSLSCFLAGLMSKAIVMLPVILLLLDLWPLKRLFIPPEQKLDWPLLRKLLLEKVPFFAAALVFGLVTLRAETAVGALRTTSEFPVFYRLCNAPLSYGSYLRHAVWPADLAVYYPPPKQLPVAAAIILAILFIGFSVAAVRNHKRRPYLLVGWLWFLITLLPTIGLIQVGSHVRADRYAYIPLIGIFILAVWALYELTMRLGSQRAWMTAFALSATVSCIALTVHQLRYWRNSELLFEHALKVTANNAVMQNALGGALANDGRYEDALRHLQGAVSLAPGYWDARNNLGTALARTGRLDEALPHLSEAVRLAPRALEPRRGLADLLVAQGKLGDAITQYRDVIQIAPADASARDAFGTTLAVAGHVDEAIEQLRVAVKLDPTDAEARCHLGIALGKANRLPEAIPELETALRLNPNSAEAHCNLGGALCAQSQWQAGIAHLKKALQLRPAYPDAERFLDAALLQSKTKDKSP